MSIFIEMKPRLFHLDENTPGEGGEADWGQRPPHQLAGATGARRAAAPGPTPAKDL